MKNRRKKDKIMILLILLFTITIGFAALAANLKIDGTVNVSKTSWDVHFENVDITPGSVTASTVPVTDDVNKNTTEITYAVNFTKPGDFYEFTVDMVNSGTIDAMIDNLVNGIFEVDGETTKTLPNYLSSSIKYNDGVDIAQNNKLAAGTSEKIKVRVAFRTDINPGDLPSSSAESMKFILKANFKQADNNATPIRVDFENDSWKDIIDMYKSNNWTSLTTAMNSGVTREVKMNLVGNDDQDETYHVRIVNLSKCENSETSETACGLVLEFVEPIASHRMNATSTNAGGWRDCEIRTYLNDAEDADSIINKLPSGLKKYIIDTTVISGHGRNDLENFETEDKLYLLSSKELLGNNTFNDSAKDDTITKQLDYYKNKGVAQGNYTNAVKKGLNGAVASWWLRSTYSTETAYFMCLTSSLDGGNALNNAGVAPVFRLSE